MTLPAWTWALPLAGLAAAAAAFTQPPHPLILVACIATLVGAVFASVHHAELVAHRIGEPFGTLVLAVAVTVIEVALVVSVMLDKGADAAALPRDTVFAAVMIVCNGIVGLCLLLGGARHFEQGFQVQGANSSFAVLGALTVLTLILPNYTLSTPGPVLTPLQLAFAGIVSLVLYGTFVFVQTVRHPQDFIAEPGPPDHAHHRPGPRIAIAAALLLVLALVVVVALAKALSPTLDHAVAAIGAPPSLVGIVIAALVLLPEGLTAVRAAHADRLQTSLNLALGSALASIGLTIPAVAATSLLIHQQLVLGLGPKDSVLLVLTLFTGIVTLGTGRTTVLQGAVHLTIFAAFLFLSIIP